MTASVGIFHTTEGSSFAGAEAAFKANNSWPHLGWDPRTNEERQYIPFSMTAKALRNMAGGVETNRRESDYLPGPDVIQVEIIGFAKDTPSWPDEYKIRLALKTIEWSARTGIPLEFPYEFQHNESYGLKGAGRLTNQQWLTARGWLGHQDVPENTHWDPGDIDWLPPLVRFLNKPTPEEPVTPAEMEAVANLTVDKLLNRQLHLPGPTGGWDQPTPVYQLWQYAAAHPTPAPPLDIPALATAIAGMIPASAGGITEAQITEAVKIALRQGTEG